ncbi:MAG TPA: DNA helicase RecQ [Candidatus Obscuribacterales bacterium]
MQTEPRLCLTGVIAHHWGIRSFRPLQREAIDAVLSGRDSLVVLPTGGGKSLCYQAPAVFRQETTVVISPLISLMKDQVDGLRSSGIGAVQLDSSQTPEERIACGRELRQGRVRLLFLSPERLVQSETCELLKELEVRTFAIDEAHCISHWGHDFRPEYRQLRKLKEIFPAASVHAYTATATEQVRQDIIQQLGLVNPEILVGDFDRKNLTYRVVSRRGPLLRQVIDVVDRHRDEGGIIYCIRRSDVDELTQALIEHGVKALPYHAGLTSQQRSQTQEAFTDEKCDVVVATVAFGMGIDRSNVRYVLHTAMPKSLEHYQQETGRAGRDGLAAECVLLYSGADFFTWKAVIEQSAANQNADTSFLQNAIAHLREIDRYCRSALCRHQLLVHYFGQRYESDNCGACDMCMGDTISVPNALEVAQKILSCVARVKERYGIGHVSSILRGENLAAIREKGHDKLSVYGLLKESSQHDVREWIYQLISQGALFFEDIQSVSGHTYSILRLNQASWEVMRGTRSVRLIEPAKLKKGQPAKASSVSEKSWDGVDKELFEKLRALRRRLADERRVPPYIIFNDATLRELATVKPTSLVRMLSISGIGDTKLRDFGSHFLEVIVEHSR